MNRKLTYTFTLFVFIVMWGVFGFAAAPATHAQAALQDTVVPTIVVTTVAQTVIAPTVIAPVVTQVVPVTGTSVGPSVIMLLFYGFLGLLAVVLLVALFASATRTTYVRRDGPPPPPDDL